MGHKVASVATSGPTPEFHHFNMNVASYTLSETASASVTICMMALPAGARVVNAALTHDNNALDATGAGGVSLQTWTGGTMFSVPVQTAAASVMEYPWNPLHENHGAVHSASSNVVVKLSNFAATGTGTGATVFTVTIVYDCQKDGG